MFGFRVCFMFLMLSTFVLFSSANEIGDEKICNILSISGGGSRGGFSASVFQSHLTNIQFDVMAGISAGALNVMFLSLDLNQTKMADDLVNIWENIRSDDVFEVLPLTFDSIVNTKPLRNTIDKHRNNRVPVRNVLISATSLDSGNPTHFDTSDLQTDTTEKVMASSAIPILFPPVKINNELLVDGGLLLNSVNNRLFSCMKT